MQVEAAVEHSIRLNRLDSLSRSKFILTVMGLFWEDFFGYLRLALLGVNVVVFAYVMVFSRKIQSPSDKNVGDVLLLIAHPDDEVMFFHPTLQKLSEQSRNVHVMCLSNGSFDGLGKVREKELQNSCNNYGNIKDTVIGSFLDGPKEVWSIESIAEWIENIISKKNIKSILTFDRYGVSGHANHSACSLGAMVSV